MNFPAVGRGPILPAPSSPTKAIRGTGISRRTAAQSAGKEKKPKRKQITAVACTPCQQRKSKCDGARPACSACKQKNRSDCRYDMNGDQRRTAALKQQILLLKEQGDELRNIIRIICDATDREGTILTVKLLPQENFENSTEVLRLLTLSTTGFVPQHTDRATQGVDEEDYDDDDDPLYSPTSATWMPEMESPMCPDGEGSWPYKDSTGEKNNQRWNRPGSYTEASPESLMTAYETPAIAFESSSERLGDGQNIGVSGMRVVPTPQTKNQGLQYVWSNRFEGITHVQCFADPTQPGTPIEVPIYVMQPVIVPNLDLMNQRLQMLIKHKRQHIEAGWPVEQVIGPMDISPASLTYPTMADAHAMSMCHWIITVLDSANMVKQPEKLAMTRLCVLFLTWAIAPSEESYNAIPVWMRPTPTQIVVPHSAWIDILPWPELREHFILLRYTDQGCGLEILQNLLSTLTIGWNLPTSDVVVAMPHPNISTLSQPFEAYIRRLENWRLDASVLLKYPKLAGIAHFSLVSSPQFVKSDAPYRF